MYDTDPPRGMRERERTGVQMGVGGVRVGGAFSFTNLLGQD